MPMVGCAYHHRMNVFGKTLLALSLAGLFAGNASADPKVLQVQLRAAQGRLKELEVENEILKKVTKLFAKESS